MQVRSPQGDLAGPPDGVLPTSFKLGCTPVARECIPMHSYLPAQASGLLWTCSPFHGAHVCDRVCPVLKVLWWKYLCAKSSINTRSRLGCGVSRILLMLDSSKAQVIEKLEMEGACQFSDLQSWDSFSFSTSISWLTLNVQGPSCLPCLHSYKNLVPSIL